MIAYLDSLAAADYCRQLAMRHAQLAVGQAAIYRSVDPAFARRVLAWKEKTFPHVEPAFSDWLHTHDEACIFWLFAACWLETEGMR